MDWAHPGHTYALRAWYGCTMVTTTGSSVGFTRPLSEEGPQDENGGNDRETHDEDHIGRRVVLRSEGIEAHCYMVRRLRSRSWVVGIAPLSVPGMTVPDGFSLDVAD